jgi:hypothetical protein
MIEGELYKRVVSVTEDYLGPAAERFIQRLINFHLNKQPAELNRADIPKLTEWVKVSLGLLTDDKRLVDDCEKKLLKLA